MIAIKRPKTKAQTEADAVDLENSIIESAKTLKKNRRKLRLGLAEAKQKSIYRQLPGKKFTSFGQFLAHLAPKTKLKAKHLRKLAKAGAAEMMLNEAGINTFNTSDSPLIALYQNVEPKTEIVSVYRKAQNDNNLGKAQPSKLHIVKAAKKLGVFKQKSDQPDTAENASLDTNNTQAENLSLSNTEEDTDDVVKLPSQRSENNDESENEDEDDEIPPPEKQGRKEKDSNQDSKKNGSNVVPITPRSVGKKIIKKFSAEDAKAIAGLISSIHEVFAEFDGNESLANESIGILKKYPLNQWNEISESILRLIEINQKPKLGKSKKKIKKIKSLKKRRAHSAR